MAGSSLDVVVKFIGDASSVEAETKKIEGTGGTLKSWAKGAAAAIGTAFVVTQIKDFTTAALEADASAARLTQTLKNAGDTSGAWAKHALDLASRLQSQTGVSDELIQGGQAILATFHSVSDATAQQSGVFDRATKAAVDLSKAGFGDVDSAAKQLGKALEDPVRGVGALGKAGVNFSADQKAMIQALIDTGDKAGAQRIILKEVEDQVGGVAAKTATSADKMKASWGETQEALGHALLPVLEQLAPILQSIAGFVKDNATWLVPLAAAIALVVLAVKAWQLAQLILNAALWTSPITWIILGIVALIAVVVLIVTHFDIFKQAAVDAWNWIKEAAMTAFNWIKENWPLILAILTGPIGVAVLLITKNWDTIKEAVSSAIDFMRGLWDGFVGFLRGIPGAIAGAFSGLFNILTQPFEDAWNTISGIASSIEGAFTSAIGFVKGIWNGFARGWNNITIHIPSVDLPIVGEVGGGSVGLPNLPILDAGAIVSKPTLAFLAANSRPEAVIPLDQLHGGTVINVNVTTGGLGADAPEIQRQVVQALRQYASRNGPIDGISR